MTTILRKLTATTLVIAALAATSPLYAHQRKPTTGHNMMMNGGDMNMKGMMDQMTKMMTLCNQMMEMSMKDMGGSNMQMPMDGQKTPEKTN